MKRALPPPSASGVKGAARPRPAAAAPSDRCDAVAGGAGPLSGRSCLCARSWGAGTRKARPPREKVPPAGAWGRGVAGRGEVCRGERPAAERGSTRGAGGAGWAPRARRLEGAREGIGRATRVGDRRRGRGALREPTGARVVGGEPTFVKGGGASAPLPMRSGRFTEPVSACLHSPKTWALSSGDGSETR